MDEMKIGSKFTTSIISKLASLAIRKKFGYDVKLNLNEVKATVVDGKTHVHLDIALYVALIIAGRRTFNQVPAKFKAAVKADLEALGLDENGNPVD